MGTIDDTFQLAGGRPLVMEALNNLVSDGAIALAVDLSMRAEIPSGPLALDVSRDFSNPRTSSSVQRMVLGHS